MSSPAPPRPTGVVSSTRQQLDELDALIERMLVLPVDAGDDLPAATEEVPPAPALAAASAPESSPITERTAEGDGQGSPGPAEIAFPRWAGAGSPDAAGQPSALPATVGKDGAPGGAGPGTAPPPGPPMRPTTGQVVSPTSIPGMALEPGDSTSTTGTSRHAPNEGRSVLAPLWWPLRCTNRVFDACTGWLGPVGRWLQGPWGRTFLGLVGLMLLAAAAALGVLDWMGWTW